MKKKSASLTTLLMLLSFAVSACQKGTPVIEIESPQAALSPMLIGVASVFMRINNSGGGDDMLISASTDIPGTITELHDITDGKMTKVENIEIPANSRVVLRPARHHIMVLKIPADFKEGATVNLQLIFKRSGQKMVSVPLTKFSAGSLSFN